MSYVCAKVLLFYKPSKACQAKNLAYKRLIMLAFNHSPWAMFCQNCKLCIKSYMLFALHPKTLPSESIGPKCTNVDLETEKYWGQVKRSKMLLGLMIEFLYHVTACKFLILLTIYLQWHDREISSLHGVEIHYQIYKCPLKLFPKIPFNYAEAMQRRIKNMRDLGR